ncbi:succinyl-CoA--3-ketoacid-CoA transferase [Photorhabdus sp. HUG-39]|uniref:3-oxoacid CoA-transferase subunit B n=1 Tax=Photorhabdus kayaii TaxID=230088 RepID=A0ABX0AZX1_9GAMM|nr:MULTISPECIES: 3-oxoacid CoA-transferase subunit B [Photorhabdus]MCC8374327.1 CoA transferase subunit B [Photorhabdus bodei]NDL10608.1 3-oxoacid CoA-transferase subunit B [Photorhabdus kayaii]NDL24074.1 3-oxoacid CoA-transferase subunit B [Photorhabdus kayaii]RAX12038.1 succinyl-CoA--3-ketoacid-CoA transferase [Photorhabdus sp. HUG-39]
MNAQQVIAHRAVLKLQDGDVVNLGIGIPTQVPNYLPDHIHITLQSENGILGLGPITEVDPNLVNAGGNPCGILPGSAIFDSALSFALIRGGHVSTCILGGLQVDQHANLASWMIPGKMVLGMGGAMDLVTGARKVIIAMKHCTKDGSAKILKQCTLPLTAINKVSMIVTELGVFCFEQGQLILKEYAQNVTLETLREKTEAEFSIAHDLKVMPVPV